jgi:hypothetical protein
MSGWYDEDTPLTYSYVIYLQDIDYETERLSGDNPTSSLRNTLQDFSLQKSLTLPLP